jgi:hypothetical protein
MYTTPRFLKFAQQFLNLNAEASKKAASEFEKIEKQERQAATAAGTMAFLQNDWFANSEAAWGEFNLGGGTTVGWTPASGSNVPNSWWNQPASVSVVSSRVEGVKTEYLQLLPLNGYNFRSASGKWKAEIVSVEPAPSGDRACYTVRFNRGVPGWGTRELRLQVALGTLRNDDDWRYKSAIRDAILEWLGGPQVNGEIALAPR